MFQTNVCSSLTKPPSAALSVGENICGQMGGTGSCSCNFSIPFIHEHNANWRDPNIFAGAKAQNV